MKKTFVSLVAAATIVSGSMAFAAGHETDNRMSMHHMHMMINHAVEMAVEGSNLIMLGQMGMAGDIDRLSVDHGEMMMKHARSLLSEVIEGPSMQAMHSDGVTPEKSKEMAYTHVLAESAQRYIDSLSSMPQVEAQH